MILEFFVGGVPKAKGSLVAGMRKDGSRFQRPQNAHGQGEWAASVKYAAQQAYAGAPVDGPVLMVLTFYRPRPKHHYVSGKPEKGLKSSSLDLLPDSAPDWDKVGRSVGDALQGVLYTNDAKATTVLTRKRWGNGGVHVVACADNRDYRTLHEPLVRAENFSRAMQASQPTLLENIGA